MVTKNNFPVLKTGSFSALEGNTFEQTGFHEKRRIMFPYGRLSWVLFCWFVFFFFLTDKCVLDVAVG